MTPKKYVLDTNIISSILRLEDKVMNRVAETLVDEAELLLCPVVFYEVYRGLQYRDAKKQLARFLEYVSVLSWDDYTPSDWQLAGQLWAELRRGGYQIADNDLLIGVYAQQRNAIVVTDNEKHFAKIEVTIENWRR